MAVAEKTICALVEITGENEPSAQTRQEDQPPWNGNDLHLLAHSEG